MIDWLDAEIPLLHRPIAQGRRLLLSPEGEVKMDAPLLRSVENDFGTGGSYSSIVSVSSISSGWLADFFADPPREGFVYGLSFRGNPTKYLQGHNIFGLACIRSLLIRTLLDIMPKLGFSFFEQSLAISRVKNWQFAVTRIDITKMFALGSDAAVNEYLQMLPFTVKARGDRTDYVKNTFYIGRNSGLWSLKFYNKFKELNSTSRKHRLPDFLPDALKDFARGQLRAELVLRKKVLNRLKLTYEPQKLQSDLDALFNDFAGKITMRNQTISDKDLSQLSNAYLGTLSLWREGKHLNSILPKETFYRHRRKLLEVGIDISKPPIPLDDRVSIVSPLKVLAPKEVNHIPDDLLPYRVKLAV